MSETKTPVRAVQVDYTCDTCGLGVMRPLGPLLLSFPPQFLHGCTSCRAEQHFIEVYPRIFYEPYPTKPADHVWAKCPRGHGEVTHHHFDYAGRCPVCGDSLIRCDIDGN